MCCREYDISVAEYSTVAAGRVQELLTDLTSVIHGNRSTFELCELCEIITAALEAASNKRVHSCSISDHCRCRKPLADFLRDIEGTGHAEIGACCGGNCLCAASSRRNESVAARAYWDAAGSSAACELALDRLGGVMRNR